MAVTGSNVPRVGLVLGAGGIRGCAHAGVISVLHEAEIPIDLVVGASVGAMFGLGLAAGLPVKTMVQSAYETSPLDLLRFYAGRLQPTRSNPIARMIHLAGDGKTFDDLELPFAVLATDMETGLPTVLRSGPVLSAVQASIAIPGVARPVEIEGRHYYDGGLADTVPVGVAREMGADQVIAMCLGFNYLMPALLRRMPWTRPILERVGRQRKPVAGHIRDQMRFGLRLAAKCFDPYPLAEADISIWPDFKGVSPNSMFGNRFCFEQGVTATRAALPEIERLIQPRLSRTS